MVFSSAYPLDGSIQLLNTWDQIIQLNTMTSLTQTLVTLSLASIPAS